MLLLGKVFFPLFLHWSNNVRHIFYHVIILRIYREAIQIEHNASEMRDYELQVSEEIRLRFNKLVIILTNVEKMKA